jgi:hypothetical protein
MKYVVYLLIIMWSFFVEAPTKEISLVGCEAYLKHRATRGVYSFEIIKVDHRFTYGNTFKVHTKLVEEVHCGS